MHWTTMIIGLGSWRTPKAIENPLEFSRLCLNIIASTCHCFSLARLMGVRESFWSPIKGTHALLLWFSSSAVPLIISVKIHVRPTQNQLDQPSTPSWRVFACIMYHVSHIFYVHENMVRYKTTERECIISTESSSVRWDARAAASNTKI